VESHSLPTGTVTFLFTDIEGSTRLLQRLGDGYAQVLREHRGLLRRAFLEHGGVEVDTEGDALFYVFGKATEAVAAAQDGQAALVGGDVRVRMGLHTGEPLLTDEGYVGIDVHLAARICASAHGGQVVVSGATAALVDAVFRELGEHRLKDFVAPQRLYQLGLSDFPPLRTPSATTNLPLQAPIVGRAHERAEVNLLLRDHRLITLVGPGGTGKTRLALQIAADASDEFEHGAWWVPLSAIGDPALVEAAVAGVLGVQDSVATHLATREVLLLLDNFEHVVDAAPMLSDWLGSAEKLKLLVTSRESLRLTDEWEYAVSPLPQADAVSLFTARARAIKSDFVPDDAVGEICRRLDGLPLALELAAARVRAMSPRQILERLDERLRLLTSGARDLPERQRTMRATIDWSYELLDPGEQGLFARLAVFSGGCTIGAAEEVCDASIEVLESLAAKSLIARTGDRVVMLETVREYAVDRLQRAGEDERRRGAHARYFLDLTEAGAPEVELDQSEAWTRRLNDEHGNIRAALERFRSTGESQLELRLVAAVWRFWFDQGRWRETTDAVQKALGSSSELTAARVVVTNAAAWTSWRQGDVVTGTSYAEEGLRQSRELGDPALIAKSLRVLGACVMDGDVARASALMEESGELCEMLGDLNGLSASLNNLALIAVASEQYPRATELLQRALSISRSSGSERGSSVCLMNLADAERHAGDFLSSRRHFDEGFALARKLGIREVVVETLYGLAFLACAVGDHVWAGRLIGAAQREGDEFGHSFEDHDRDEFERTMAILRQHLGDNGVEDEIVAGRELTPDLAIVFRMPPAV
jgi:predicted ATPase